MILHYKPWQEETELAFAFRWSKLKGRQLVSWANPTRIISRGRKAYQDEVFVSVSIPLETSISALSEYVNKVVQPLYEIFEGFSLSKDVVEDLTKRLIERRL